MLTSLYPDLEAVDELSRTFAERELAGQGTAHDRAPLGASMERVLARAFEAGFLSTLLAGTPDGSAHQASGDPWAGLGPLSVVLLRLCRSDASLGGILYASALGQALLGAAGERSVLAALARATSATEALVACPIYADPSQVPDLPEARPATGEGKGRDGSLGDHRLSGKVELVVPGPLAARAILPARGPGDEGWSLFLVEVPGQGVTLSPPVLTLGLQGCPASDVELSSAPARLLGEAGQGARYHAQVLGPLAAAAAAMNAGILGGCFDEASAYAHERRQGGRRIADWSALRMILGELGVRAEAARLLAEGACLSLLHGEPGAALGAVAAALAVGDLACEGVTDGVQVLGGYGYMKDYGQEKRYRDARQVRALLGLGPASKLAFVTVGEGA